MNESLLKALMRLFSLIENIHDELNHAYTHSYIELFLKNEYSDEIVKTYIETYEKYYGIYSHVDALVENKTEKMTDELRNVARHISMELPPKKRFALIINILQLVKFFKTSDYKYPLSEGMSRTIGLIAHQFKIPLENYLNVEAFILDSLHRMPNKKALLIVSDVQIYLPDVKVIHRDRLDGQIYFMFDESVNMYLFFYKGTSQLEMNDKIINPKQLYLFGNSASISSKTIDTLYYNDIVRRYLYSREHTKITYIAENISYQYKNSNSGIRPFSFSAYSGQLIAIMGGSGVGKSTLMNLLNGTLSPLDGKITINGYNLFTERVELADIMGYVPQNDLLLESLTVYENLYYNARLSFGDLSETAIREKVHHVLSELELYDIRNLKVGSAIDKVISGGERKRLNIALELIRDPSVIFLDEPTSGLSSMDAENIMHILQDLTLQGRLIIVNIHQPSSAIFRLFDQLIFMDKGGYPVYVGNTMDALRYFKKHVNRIDLDMIECKSCHNLYPELLFQILEEKEINELGQSKGKRKRSPKEWYALYLMENQKVEPTAGKEALPEKKIRTADKWQQFIIQTARNLRSKYADKQFMFMANFVAPVLALLLAFFCRYLVDDNDGGLTYVFAKNENIPAYLLMSVIVALFVGMIMSAEELFHDRGLRSREKYHNLSSFSYLNAKVIVLIMMSAIQAASYVLIGNLILEIKGMWIMYWVILFSLFVLANLIGLNVSSSLKSIVAIYIMVPMILVPQILFSGVIVKFDKLHPSTSSARYVPLVGEVMPSRWAYEALMVTQYRDNEFQKYFFEIERKDSRITYLSYYFIPEFQRNLNIWLYAKGDAFADKNELIFNGLDYFRQRTGRSFIPDLTPDKLKKSQYNDIHHFFELYETALKDMKKKSIAEKDSLYRTVVAGFPTDMDYKKFRDSYFNDKVAEFVLNKTEVKRIKIEKNHFIPIYEPIYQDPLSSYGRAHYYAPEKKVGSYLIETPVFNIIIMWIISIIMYLLLIYNGAERIISKAGLFKKLAKFA